MPSGTPTTIPRTAATDAWDRQQDTGDAGGLPMLLFARETPFVINGAPVLNGIAVVAKAAEMALALKEITKTFVSRHSTYAKAPADSIREFLAVR